MKLKFCGGAKMVTGSNYLLTSDSTNILVDCGLHQGSNYCEKHNFEPFPYDPKTIDALFVTHGHVDHVGRIPKLVKEGFKGEIYSTPPTRDIAELLLLDSEHLINKEAFEKGIEPLYGIEDINKTLSLWKTVKYHQKIRVKELEIELFDAGHILGSSFIRVLTNDGKRIIFSGDLGNVPSPLVKDTEKIVHADYILMESTYGNRIHEDAANRKNLLEKVIEDTVKSGGALMIPALAMERTQELLFELNELIENKRIPKIPIFVDSPLAIKLTSVYKKYSKDPDYLDQEALALAKSGDEIFNFPGLRTTLTKEESKEINNVANPKIIIAGSGMSQGGRILHHEMRYLPDPKSAILFISYQAKGSLGRQILEGAKSVKIRGEQILIKCQSKAIGGYSAHADQAGLLNWLEPMRLHLKKVFVVQGEEEEMVPLSEKIIDELAIETIIPSLGDEFVL